MILPISRKHSEQLCCFATKHFVKKTHVLLEIDLFLIQNTCYLLQRGSVFLNLQPRTPLKLSGISKSSLLEELLWSGERDKQSTARTSLFFEGPQPSKCGTFHTFVMLIVDPNSNSFSTPKDLFEDSCVTRFCGAPRRAPLESETSGALRRLCFFEEGALGGSKVILSRVEKCFALLKYSQKEECQKCQVLNKEKRFGSSVG